MFWIESGKIKEILFDFFLFFRNIEKSHIFKDNICSWYNLYIIYFCIIIFKKFILIVFSFSDYLFNMLQ
jgi:hypothetical protein